MANQNIVYDLSYTMIWLLILLSCNNHDIIMVVTTKADGLDEFLYLFRSTFIFMFHVIKMKSAVCKLIFTVHLAKLQAEAITFVMK